MAIAYDTGTDGGESTGTTLTWSHTCTGSQRFLVVALLEVATDSVTGVTYNGSAMFQMGTTVTQGGNTWTNLWGIKNPSSGANNIVATRTLTTDKLRGVATSYTGVNQTGEEDSVATNTSGASTSFTLTTTTVADNCWLVGTWRNGGTTSVAGAGTVVRVTSATASNSFGLADSNSVKTPAGSDSLVITSTSVTWAGIVASFDPYIAPTGPTGIKTYNTLTLRAS